MDFHRVVITGLGLVTPVGIGKERVWHNLLAGESGIGPITQFDANDYPSRIAGEVSDFQVEDWMDLKDARRCDRFIHLAMAAATLALQDAQMDPAEVDPSRVGVVVGSGIGGLPWIEANHTTLTTKGPRRLHPFFIPGSIINLASGQISRRFGFKGPNSATCTACATGAHAIGDAYTYLRLGYADAILAGGTESVITPLAVGGFSVMRALSTRNDEPEKASRPWDQDRDGFVIAEGSGILILETLEHAKKRGASIYAEIIGFGMSGDAYHVAAPDPEGEGAALAMANALKDAGIEPSELDYINAHGTSTPAGDVVEIKAIKKVFGQHAYKLQINSTKSMIGHLLGAAGGVETAVCALTLYHQETHPTLNLTNPDPECDLNLTPGQKVKGDYRVALNNSFGFGGTNACIVLRRWEE